MSSTIEMLLREYTEAVAKIYGKYLKSVILYGSYARGDFTKDSDIDIMILLDLTDMEIKNYRHNLSGITFEFNMDHDIDIKPIAKSEAHFKKWVDTYPFYATVKKEGVKLFVTRCSQDLRYRAGSVSFHAEIDSQSMLRQ